MFHKRIKYIVETIILSLIALLIIYLYITQKMGLLINPKFDGFMVISIFILSLFIYNRIKNFIRQSGVEENPIQKKYIPFIFMIILAVVPSYTQFQSNISKVKGLQLGDSTAYQSNNIYSNTIEDNDKNLDKQDTEEESDTVKNSEGRIIKINDKDFVSRINSIYENPEQYSGSSVTLKGFVYRIRSKKKYPKIFGISRMAMYCCAADSVPIGLICNSSKISKKFRDNKWYKITGTLKFEKIKIRNKNEAMPVLYISEYKRVKNPGSPYVYPY